MTALTIYMTNIADSTFTTCNQLISTSGSPSTITVSTKIGTSTGYGEVYSQGNTNAWAASGSIGSPSLQGWIYDTSFLNNAMLAGNWTPTLRLNVSNGSIVADIHVRAYSYVLSGFVQIGSDMILSAQTITTGTATYSFSATSEPLQAMNYLYLDCWLNITSNSTGSSGALVRITLGNSATLGYTLAQVVTPGYSPITSVKKDGSSRFKMSGNKKLDGKTRFLLYKGLNASTRLLTRKQKYQNGITRFSTAVFSSVDAKIRFIQLSTNRQKDGSLLFKMVSGPIIRDVLVRGAQRNVTSQTLYMSTTASAIIAGADKLLTPSGSPTTASKSTLIGTATGYGEINSQGTSAVWGGGTQNILPDGSGYICEATTFEGSVFVPGAWSASLKMNASAGSIVADIHVRAYQWHNNNTLLGVYYFIADMVLTAQTISTVLKAYTVTSNTTIPSGLFQVGDKLYADITLDITSSKTNNGAAKIFNTAANSSTVGSSTIQLITSGYSVPAATNRDGTVRFKVASGTKQKFASTRFRLSVNKLLFGTTRFKVAGQRYKFGTNRFKQSAVSSGKDAANRFKLASVTQYKNAVTRLATQGQRSQSGINRFKLASAQQFKRAATRFLMRATKQRDSQTRFLQRTPTQYRDASTRFKALLPSFKNGVTRFLQVSGTQFKSATSRFKQSGSVVKSAITRLKLSGFLQRNANARFRQSVPKTLGAGARLKAQGQVYKLGTNRFRLNSPVRYQDSNTRFRQSVPKSLSGISRFRQSVPVLRSAIARFKLISPTIYRMASTRFLQSVPIQRSGISRFRQSVPRSLDAIVRIKTRVARIDSFSSRFRLNSVVQYHDASSRFKQYGLVLKSASARLKTRFQQLPSASLRMRLSGFVQDYGIVRLLTRMQVLKYATTRLKLSGSKVPSAIIRFLANMFVARSAPLRFRQSVTVTHSYDMRLRIWGAPYLSFAILLRQRVNVLRSAITRFRISKVVTKSATCRLQTYHFNPRDGHMRFVLRPSTVSPISSATTEILFRDGTVEMVFRS